MTREYHEGYQQGYKDAKEEGKEPTTKNNLGVDWDELKRKILMEVDGGTDDKWLSYGDVCDRISNSIDEYIAELPSVTPQLSVPEVTALAEWTEKLTKASEDAYNKGYADGVKSVNICPHCGEYIGEEE